MKEPDVCMCDATDSHGDGNVAVASLAFRCNPRAGGVRFFQNLQLTLEAKIVRRMALRGRAFVMKIVIHTSEVCC